MELEFLKESINNCIEIRRNFWMALLGLVGALFALFVTPAIIIPFKTLLFFIDIFLIIITIFVIYWANKEISKFLEQIKEL